MGLSSVFDKFTVGESSLSAGLFVNWICVQYDGSSLYSMRSTCIINMYSLYRKLIKTLSQIEVEPSLSKKKFLTNHICNSGYYLVYNEF